MSKITDYTAATRFGSGDVMIIDGSGGTRKIAVADAAVEFAGLVSAVMHRNIFRGKNLGTSVTASQKAAIQNGTFDDIYIGDYWVINGVTWVVADMDYFYQCGDTAFTRHHLVVVPSKNLYSHVMNDTNTTEGGYVGSKMYTEGLDNAKTAFSNAFGDMLLTHRDYLVNAVTDGHPSAGAWYDSQVELMNEVMVYGSHIVASMNTGNPVPTKYTTAKMQLALYRLNIKALDNRENIWLRDIVSSAYFARVDYRGLADYNHASSSSGVRPYGCIG